MYFEDLKIGMTVEISPAVIEKEKMMAFARDYDNIPLHTDEEYAKTTNQGRFSQKIAQKRGRSARFGLQCGCDRTK